MRGLCKVSQLDFAYTLNRTLYNGQFSWQGQSGKSYIYWDPDQVAWINRPFKPELTTKVFLSFEK